MLHFAFLTAALLSAGFPLVSLIVRIVFRKRSGDRGGVLNDFKGPFLDRLKAIAYLFDFLRRKQIGYEGEPLRF